jgi:hypothetical protein
LRSCQSIRGIINRHLLPSLNRRGHPTRKLHRPSAPGKRKKCDNCEND